LNSPAIVIRNRKCPRKRKERNRKEGEKKGERKKIPLAKQGGRGKKGREKGGESPPTSIDREQKRGKRRERRGGREELVAFFISLSIIRGNHKEYPKGEEEKKKTPSACFPTG